MENNLSMTKTLEPWEESLESLKRIAELTGYSPDKIEKIEKIENGNTIFKEV